MHKVTIVTYVQDEGKARSLADWVTSRIAEDDDFDAFVITPVVEKVSPALDDNALTALNFFEGKPF